MFYYHIKFENPGTMPPMYVCNFAASYQFHILDNPNLFCLAILKLICLAQIMWLEPSSHKQISTSVSCDLKWTVCKPVNSFCLFLQLLSRILNYLLPFVTTIFVGHIGNAELAGYALASAVLCLLLLSLIICCTCSRTNFISCETLL